MAQEIKVTFDAETKGLKSKVKGIGDETKKAKGGFDQLIPSISQIKFAGVAAFAAVGAAAVQSVKAFSKFDNELRGVKTLLNESTFGAVGLDKGFQDLTNEVLNLASTTPVAIESLTKALFDTVSAGIDAGDAIEFLGAAANLSIAGLTDISVATNGLTNVINAFSLEASDASDVAAAFFGAQRDGKTTVEALATSIGTTATIAKEAGLDYETLLAATSALTVAAIDTNSAFVGIKAAISNINKPTADATAEAKRLKIAFSAKELRDNGLPAFLDSITNSANFNKDSLAKLFGSTQALGVAQTLTGSQADKFREILGKLNNKTQLQQDFQVATKISGESLSNTYKTLANKTDVLAIRLGERLGPAAAATAKIFGLFADSLQTESTKSAAVQVSNLAIKQKELREELAKTTNAFGRALYGDGSKQEREIAANDSLILSLARQINATKKAADERKAIAEKDSADKKAIDDAAKEKEDKAAADKIVKDAEVREISRQLLADFNEEQKQIKDALVLAEIEKESKDNDTKLKGLESFIKQTQAQVKLNNKIKLATEATTVEKIKQLKDKETTDSAIAQAKADADKIKKEQELSKKRLNIQGQYASNVESIAGNLNRILVASGGKHNKALFAIEKAAAIARIFVSTQLSAALALATPPVPNFPLATLVQISGGVGMAAVAAETISAFAKGGEVTGGISGVDSVPIVAQRGELISPRSSFDEVIGSVRASREAQRIQEQGGSTGGVSEIIIGMKDDFIEVVEQRIVERQSLGISILGAV